MRNVDVPTDRLNETKEKNRIYESLLMNPDQLPATGAIVIAAPLKIADGSSSRLRMLTIVPA